MSRTGVSEEIDLVEEQEAGNAAVLQLLHDQLQRRHALGVGLAHDDGGVAGGQRQRTFVLEFDRAGRVDEGEAVAEEGGVGNVELDAHAVVARFRGSVSNRVPVRHLALARDGAGANEDGFEQGGLAGEIGPNQCDAAGAAAGWASGLPHGVLLKWLRRMDARRSAGRPAPEFPGARRSIVNPHPGERKAEPSHVGFRAGKNRRRGRGSHRMGGHGAWQQLTVSG